MLLCDSTSSHHLFTRNIISHLSITVQSELCIYVSAYWILMWVFFLFDWFLHMCWLIHPYTECVFEKGEWRYELDLCKSQHSKMRKFMWYEYRILISETWTSKTVTFIFYENKSRKKNILSVCPVHVFFFTHKMSC